MTQKYELLNFSSDFAPFALRKGQEFGKTPQSNQKSLAVKGFWLYPYPKLRP